MNALTPLLPTLKVPRDHRAIAISVRAELITDAPRSTSIPKSESDREWVLAEGQSLIFGTRRGTVRPGDALLPWNPDYFPSVRLRSVSQELLKLELGVKSALMIFAPVPEEWEFSPFTVRVAGKPLQRIAGPFAFTSVDLAKRAGQDLVIDISEATDPRPLRVLRLTVRVVGVGEYVRTEMTPSEDQEASIASIRTHWWTYKYDRKHKYIRFLAFVLDALERREAGHIGPKDADVETDVRSRGKYSAQTVRDRVSQTVLSLYATPRRFNTAEWNANLRIAGLAGFLPQHDDVVPSSDNDGTRSHSDSQVFEDLVPIAERLRAIGLAPADDIDRLLATRE